MDDLDKERLAKRRAQISQIQLACLIGLAALAVKYWLTGASWWM